MEKRSHQCTALCPKKPCSLLSFTGLCVSVFNDICSLKWILKKAELSAFTTLGERKTENWIRLRDFGDS